MKFYDYTQLALTSLWQSKLSTLLTVLGVIIGVGALTSMISYGTGMQKNITDSFKIAGTSNMPAEFTADHMGGGVFVPVETAKAIFFVEASVIGFIGAIFGLGLGWEVTRIANQIMNAKIVPEEMPSVDMFYFPWWLITGAIAFSILLSLAAGLYPAMKAVNTDPVKALRHE